MWSIIRLGPGTQGPSFPGSKSSRVQSSSSEDPDQDERMFETNKQINKYTVSLNFLEIVGPGVWSNRWQQRQRTAEVSLEATRLEGEKGEGPLGVRTGILPTATAQTIAKRKYRASKHEYKNNKNDGHVYIRTCDCSCMMTCRGPEPLYERCMNDVGTSDSAQLTTSAFDTCRQFRGGLPLELEDRVKKVAMSPARLLSLIYSLAAKHKGKSVEAAAAS